MNKTDYNRFEITYLTDNIKFAESEGRSSDRREWAAAPIGNRLFQGRWHNG